MSVRSVVMEAVVRGSVWWCILLALVTCACRPAARRENPAVPPVPRVEVADAAATAVAQAAGSPGAGVSIAASAAAGLSAVASPAVAAERWAVLRATHKRGVPVHPGVGDRKISARLPDGTRVAVVETARNGRWLRVRSADGVDGWVVARYVQLDPSPAGASARAPQGLPHDFPLPGGACPTAIPDPAAKLVEAAIQSRATVPGAQSLPEDGRLVVVSYNVWELYDGRDGDRYLGDDRAEPDRLHEPSHAARRVEVLGAAVREAAPHLLVLQEVEDAALACAVARVAVPGAGWSCWASSWASEPHPQNVAVASRVGGEVIQLDPGRGMGLRGVLEWTHPDGKLRVAAVHFKSSLGAVGIEDCDNARKRMALAWGLVQRQADVPGPAYLVVGDFNVDPTDPRKAEYDRTDDILALAGGEDLLLQPDLYRPDDRPHLGVRRDDGLLRPHALAGRRGGASRRTGWVVNRAMLRPGVGVEVLGIGFLDRAPRRGWASDHVPLAVELRVR